MGMQDNDGAELTSGQSQDRSLDSPDLMGVRVVVDPDPDGAAARLAETINGEVVRDIDHARRAFAARAVGGVDAVLASAEKGSALQEGPAIDAAAVAELRSLADALRRTDRIRTRTEDTFTEGLNRKLAANKGVAVHPEAIKQAAQSLTAAEADVNEVNRAIGELGQRPLPRLMRRDAPADVPTMFDEPSLEHQRRARVFALSVATIFAGVALALIGMNVDVVFPAVVFLLGLIIAGTIMARSYSRELADDPGAREASALLASVGDHRDVSEDGLRDRVAEEEWLARRAQLEASGERALERARSARRHWEILAGPEADPYDLDSVLRLHDPNFVITGAATKTSPTVRTVNAVHRKALARWRVAWAALGYDQPPAPEEIDEHLARLARSSADGDGDGAADRADDRRTTAPLVDRPMILVEPEGWLPEEELEAMLRTLPDAVEVVIITR